MKWGLGMVAAIVVLGTAAHSSPAQTSAIQFVVRIRPASGIAEPARGIPFVLLSKSYGEIQKEADAAEPKPDFDAFIDGLTVSAELKSWLKKNHCTALSGEDFVKKIKADDIINVPEFYRAYLELHAGEQSVGFPEPKYKAKDEKKDPAKYERLKQEYHDAIKKYFVDNPQSADGIDLHLVAYDPGPQWKLVEGKRVPQVRRDALDAAQSRYLVGRCETDLNGQAAFEGVPPGQYWLSTLDVEAVIGDAHLKWDVPVTVQPGEVTRVELSNVNAVELRKPLP
jgi:hypothetical protein